MKYSAQGSKTAFFSAFLFTAIHAAILNAVPAQAIDIGNKTEAFTLASNQVFSENPAILKSAVVFNGKLVAISKGIVSQDIGGDNRIYIQQYNNGNWLPGWTELPGGGRTSEAPALAVFNNRLVAVIRGEDNRIYINSADSNLNWNSQWQVIPGDGRTGAAPSLGRCLFSREGQG
jgi:hypothetical protein